jgi:hypothetical protein
VARTQQNLERVAGLAREQPLGGERRYLKDEAIGIGGNGFGQFGRKRQGLRSVFGLLFLVFRSHDGNVARVGIEFLVLSTQAPGEETEQNRQQQRITHGFDPRF